MSQAIRTHSTLEKAPPRYLRVDGDYLAPDFERGDYVGLVPVEAFCQAGLYLLTITPRPELYVCRAAGEGMIEVRQGRAAQPLVLSREQFRVAAVAVAWGPLRRDLRSKSPRSTRRVLPPTRGDRRDWLGAVRHQISRRCRGVRMLAGEFAFQAEVASFLDDALPAGTFWTSVESFAGLDDPTLRTRLIERGVKCGFPDVLVVHRGRLIVLELKTGAAELSPAQERVRSDLRTAGAAGHLARDLVAVEDALRGEGVPLRWRMLL